MADKKIPDDVLEGEDTAADDRAANEAEEAAGLPAAPAAPAPTKRLVLRPEPPPSPKPRGAKHVDRIIYLCIAAAALVLLMTMATIYMVRIDNKKMLPGTQAFTNSDPATVSADGVKATLRDAYYTVDGSFFIRLEMTNGTTFRQTVNAYTVQILSSSGQLIAYANIGGLNSPVIAAGGSDTVQLYIPRGQVITTGDPLVTLTLEANVTHTSS